MERARWPWSALCSREVQGLVEEGTLMSTSKRDTTVRRLQAKGNACTSLGSSRDRKDQPGSQGQGVLGDAGIWAGSWRMGKFSVIMFLDERKNNMEKEDSLRHVWIIL